MSTPTLDYPGIGMTCALRSITQSGPLAAVARIFVVLTARCRIFKQRNLNAEPGPCKLLGSTEYFRTSVGRSTALCRGSPRAALRRMFERLR